ncbi:Os04g0371350 [Oryza sativa Japonica Group]|uniref:Os04g0371350 protein n=2 Tax=Oryza sativa subsp. japonica TaxID=39947 RepID=B9FEQ9_ORYSJ|nr:hypothetical protein OsJ_14467 [Oryza sativa Japonica Group]BAS88820.1 Os04g0371350 [Oryza sativa Japonica Group]
MRARQRPITAVAGLEAADLAARSRFFPSLLLSRAAIPEPTAHFPARPGLSKARSRCSRTLLPEHVTVANAVAAPAVTGNVVGK